MQHEPICDDILLSMMKTQVLILLNHFYSETFFFLILLGLTFVPTYQFHFEMEKKKTRKINKSSDIIRKHFVKLQLFYE